MANFWDGSNAEVLDQDGNPVGSTGPGEGGPTGAQLGDGAWNHYGQPQIVDRAPDVWRGPGTRQPPSGGGDPNNPYGLQPGTYTGGGAYPLASVMGEGWMQPWTTPFYAAGFNGGPAFKAPTAADMQMDPGYEVRMAEGAKALQRGAAAKGTLLTGGTQKDLMSWAQGQGSQEYGAVYNRKLGENQQAYNRSLGEYQMGYGNAANEYAQAYNIWSANSANQFNRSQAIKGSGQAAANQLGQYGSNYANNAGNIAMGIGNAQASGTVGAANAWSQSISNSANTAMGAYYGRPSTNKPTGSAYNAMNGYGPVNQPAPDNPWSWNEN